MAPIISARETISLPLGSEWKLVDLNVIAKDKEARDILVNIIFNNINLKISGTYNVTLEAKDTKGLITTKRIIVKIMANNLII